MTNKVLFLIGFVILGFSFSSCEKGCDFPDNCNAGDIIPDAIVYG
jgi:hypothetical protein